MKKISNDNNFENYLNKFVNVEVNGVTKKFFVTEINANSFITNAGILNDYTTLGESSIQECDVCEDVCYNNIPVIKVMFENNPTPEYNGLINNFYSEIHELILNGTSLGRINTTFQKGKHNEVWFVPYNPSNVIVSTTYASSSNSSIYNTVAWGNIDSLVLSSFNASLLNKNDYNEISIRPVSAWNPVLSYPDYALRYTPPLSTAFFLSPLVTLDIHKILPLTSNTSSISCQSYTMHRFNNSSVDYNLLTFNSSVNDPIILNFSRRNPYVTDYMYDGCVFQPFSASFYYYDPCQINSPAYYPLDPEYYYTYGTGLYYRNIFGVKFAYGWANHITMYPEDSSYPSGLPNNPILPLLRKYVFFNSPNINDKLYLFLGSNTQNPSFRLEEEHDGYDTIYHTRNIILGYTDEVVTNFIWGISPDGFSLYTTKYANELFEGIFYTIEDRTADFPIAGSINFRQMRVDKIIDPDTGSITQNFSAGAVINL